MHLLKYVARRLLGLVPLLLGIVTISFFLARALPGDPVLIQLPIRWTMEDYLAAEHRLGLDRSLPVQYFIYVRNLLVGDWGNSYIIGRGSPVELLIRDRLPRTIELMVACYAIAVPLGVKLGKVSVNHQGRPLDTIVRGSSYVLVSFPAFLLGVVAWYLNYRYDFLVLPYSGYRTPGLAFPPEVTYFYSIDCLLALRIDLLVDYACHMVLPLTCLVLAILPRVTRQTRASLLEVIQMPYIRTARAKGCTEKIVINKHALRNALIPTITAVSLSSGLLFAGCLAIEVVFDLPGMGHLLWTAVREVDYPVLNATVFLIALVVVVFNLLADILYAVVDPRVRYK